MQKQCFVAMPFDGSCDTAYSEAVLPACNELAMKCIRVDAETSNNSIMQDVVRGIFESDIVVVNITNLSPNVFYELGISHALPYANKTICIARRDTPIPFDIYAYRVVIYDDNPPGRALLRAQLKERIKLLLDTPSVAGNPVQDAVGYYDSVVMTQSAALARHHISLDYALQNSRHSLILMGTTLHSVRNQAAITKIQRKVANPEFRELSLVLRAPGAREVSPRIARHLDEFVRDEDIAGLLQLNDHTTHKVFIYLATDFIRYSATYIDHTESFGQIRVTHSIYGSLMEDSPSYVVTRKKNQEVYEAFVKAWENLKSRPGIRRVADITQLNFEAPLQA